METLKLIDKTIVNKNNFLHILNIESRTSNIGEKINNKTKQLSKWQQTYNKEQLYRLQNILDYFKVDYYHVENALPIKQKHT